MRVTVPPGGGVFDVFRKTTLSKVEKGEVMPVQCWLGASFYPYVLGRIAEIDIEGFTKVRNAPRGGIKAQGESERS